MSVSIPAVSCSQSANLHELSLAEKERKGYNTKIDLITNRIKNLQQKQRELDLRIKAMKHIENQNYNFQQFKRGITDELQTEKRNQNATLKEKQAHVQKCKLHRSESMKSSLNKHQHQKQQQFNESRAEHVFTVSMLSQYNNHQYNVNKCKIAKEKLNRMKTKAEKEKQRAYITDQLNQLYKYKIDKEKHETSKLKNELQELEKYEEKCMQQLHQTQLYKSQMDKSFNSKHSLTPTYKRNKSFTSKPKVVRK